MHGGGYLVRHMASVCVAIVIHIFSKQALSPLLDPVSWLFIWIFTFEHSLDRNLIECAY